MPTFRETFTQGTGEATVDEMIAELRLKLSRRNGRILQVVRWRQRDSKPHRAEIVYTLESAETHPDSEGIPLDPPNSEPPPAPANN